MKFWYNMNGGVTMKKRMRENTLNTRNSMAAEEIADKSRIIFQRLINFWPYKESENIFSYLSFGSEVATKDIIDYSIAKEKKVSIPLCIKETKEMVACSFSTWQDLSKGTYGILEPNKQSLRIIDRTTIDLILVPGVAFDKIGNRIGYGAGYYDRFLNRTNKNTCTIALAFSLQMVPKISRGIFDVPLDYIITEDGIIRC